MRIAEQFDMSAAQSRAMGTHTGSTQTSDAGTQTRNTGTHGKHSGWTQTEGGSSASSGPVAATEVPIYTHHPITRIIRFTPSSTTHARRD